MNANTKPCVDSRVETPRWLVEQKVALRIPSYQRPYVWPAEDVTKLLDDIAVAHDADDQHYYIGTLLSAKNPSTNPAAGQTHELIDGQQRMTTLMLLTLAFRKYLPEKHPLNRLTVIGQHPRLTFAVRDQVQELLGHWAGLTDYAFPGEEAIQKDDYLKHIYGALVAAENRLKSWQTNKHEGYLEEIANFLYDNVKWVNNTMPNGMDLNKLFATMNTSGIQLEQTDILKSQLLRKIHTNKHSYDAIWQACENLNNYFERNVRKLFPEADWNTLEYHQLSCYDPNSFPLIINSNGTRTSPLTIAKIAEQHTELRATSQDDKPPASAEEQEGSTIYCRSVISFALLLMHTFRIYQGQRASLNKPEDITVRLSEKRLAESFAQFIETAEEPDAKGFIECLWQVRYQFDRWVIKWVELAGEDTEHLRLSTVSRSRSGNRYQFSRTPLKSSNLSQLQSVRLFTGDRSAQYWLTPFLGWLIRNKSSNTAQVLSKLEQIDNQLSLAEYTQKEASFDLLVKRETATRDIKWLLEELHQPKGTGFEHYWFQKLEYILWRERDTLRCFDSPEKLARYRITSRNSVEHRR